MGNPWNGTLNNQPRTHLIYSGYLLGILSQMVPTCLKNWQSLPTSSTTCVEKLFSLDIFQRILTGAKICARMCHHWVISPTETKLIPETNSSPLKIGPSCLPLPSNFQVLFLLVSRKFPVSSQFLSNPQIKNCQSPSLLHKLWFLVP